MWTISFSECSTLDCVISTSKGGYLFLQILTLNVVGLLRVLHARVVVRLVHGANGAHGSDGADGSEGADGAEGADGHDGSVGADGANGYDGSDGADRTDGADEADVADGPNGSDGADVSTQACVLGLGHIFVADAPTTTNKNIVKLKSYPIYDIIITPSEIENNYVP